MIDDSVDICAFESFTLADAGGDKTSPSTPKKEASHAPEHVESRSETVAKKTEPVSPTEDITYGGGRLQSSLDRMPNASAAATRTARENGINIIGIKGSGIDGQISEADVKKLLPSGASSSTIATTSFTDIPTSSMRNTIANRLTQSVNQNPHFFVSSALSVAKLLKLKDALNSVSDGRYKLSLNDFLIKAAGIACKKVPVVNSSWRDGFIRQYSNVDISVSISTSEKIRANIS